MSKKQGKKSFFSSVLFICIWIIAFPIMVILFLYRKDKISKKTAIIASIVAGVIWFPIVFAVTGSNSVDSSLPNEQSSETSVTRTASDSSIKSLSLSYNKDIELKIGETASGNVQVSLVSYKARESFSPEDVLFVSDDPNVATISFDHDALTTYLYYKITAVGPGETVIYATSKDGSIVSEQRKVTVPEPIVPDSISITVIKNEMVLGETLTPKVTFSPSNTESRQLQWTSSDETVATVDVNGIVSAVSGGSTTITATTINGITESFDIEVDGTKHLMKLRVLHVREDDNNIGDDWSYLTEINGEPTSGSIGLAAGERITLSARFTEEDDSPDIGKASTVYKVKETDISEGFTVTLDLYVRENGGKNSGKSAHFVITYEFTPPSN